MFFIHLLLECRYTYIYVVWVKMAGSEATEKKDFQVEPNPHRGKPGRMLLTLGSVVSLYTYVCLNIFKQVWLSNTFVLKEMSSA